MSAQLAEVLDFSPRPPARKEIAGWTAWLEAQLDPDWRRGEWDRALWLFTGDLVKPETAVWPCSTLACDQAVIGRGRRCRNCEKALACSAMSEQEFDSTYVPLLNRRLGRVKFVCIVERSGVRCGREQSAQGLCAGHHGQWRYMLREHGQVMDFEQWLAARPRPYAAWPSCPVAGCDFEGSGASGLCRIHAHRWRQERAGHEGNLKSWIALQAPYLTVRQFCLAPLAKTVRLELLYVLEQRDRRNPDTPLNPSTVNYLAAELAACKSLALGTPVTLARSSKVVASLLRGAYRELAAGLDRFRGIDPTDRRRWELSSVGLPSSHRDGSRRQPGQVDFTRITQSWLQEVVWEWARSVMPEGKVFQPTFQACVIASRALGRRPGAGVDARTLDAAAMDVVVEEFRVLRHSRTGEVLGAKQRAKLLHHLFALLDFGRRAGLMQLVPGSFARHQTHRIPVSEASEDEIGKAIPESVIRQLDAHLQLLGAETHYGEMAPTDVALMMQTVYLLLRDTGRRPLEIARLDRDPIERVDGDYNLIWHNTKARRLGRRLPVTAATVEAIRAWQARRDLLPVNKRTEKFLFPAVKGESGYGHLTVNHIGRAIRAWSNAIPVIDSEIPGPDGLPLPFERSLIYAYALRHSYAQRFADAGTDLDVLRALMDHRSASTTQRYYRVSLKRKREAVDMLRVHVVDRHGASAPMSSGMAYESRSVAVPYGNCIEPQNVKAGGKGCRIRFQCAGCGFYRPDPSYLPAIEEHINALRTDREDADGFDAAEFVIRNLTDQIVAFKSVAETMNRRLQELPAIEREQIRDASSVLRKTRAARALLPVTVINPTRRNAQP